MQTDEERYTEIMQFHDGKPPAEYTSLLESLLFVARSERGKAADLRQLIDSGWKP